MAKLAEPRIEPGIIDPMVPDLIRVDKLRQETPDTFTVHFVYPDGRPFRFEPGQFNMLGILGVGEVPISISGDPDQPEVLVHTIRDVGAVTTALHRVKPGDFVTVRGPFGRPWPMEVAEGRDVVIVTGGIGIAPVRPVIYSVLNHRARFGKFSVLYGTRTRADLLYEKEVMHWRSQFDIDVLLTLDHGQEDWRGNVGVVTQLIPRIGLEPENTIAMICGPEIMIRFTVQGLAARGLSKDLIYVSMERNMKCGIGLCGHCQVRGSFVCKDGPVYRYSEVAPWLSVREL